MKKKTKQSILFGKLREKRVFSSVDAKKIGNKMYFSTAYRRVQEEAQKEFWYLNGKFRRLPNKEAIERGYVKKGNKPLAWFEATV